MRRLLWAWLSHKSSHWHRYLFSKHLNVLWPYISADIKLPEWRIPVLSYTPFCLNVNHWPPPVTESKGVRAATTTPLLTPVMLQSAQSMHLCRRADGSSWGWHEQLMATGVRVGWRFVVGLQRAPRPLAERDVTRDAHYIGRLSLYSLVVLGAFGKRVMHL